MQLALRRWRKYKAAHLGSIVAPCITRNRLKLMKSVRIWYRLHVLSQISSAQRVYNWIVFMWLMAQKRPLLAFSMAHMCCRCNWNVWTKRHEQRLLVVVKCEAEEICTKENKSCLVGQRDHSNSAGVVLNRCPGAQFLLYRRYIYMYMSFGNTCDTKNGWNTSKGSVDLCNN